MKKILLSTLLLSSMVSTNVAFSADVKLDTIDKRASYTLGTDLAKNFEHQGVNIDVQALVLGMKDVQSKQKLRLTNEEMQKAVQEVKQQVLKKQAEALKVKAEKNAQKGDAFLAQNKTKDGVKVTKSGLQYKVITEGAGTPPTESDYLTANYRGTLIDGTEFDSSYKRGSPIDFQMSNVIKGWGEALKMMKPGAKWEIYVPPHLGYGSKGAGDVIGPNETLIFTIELIKVDKEKPSHG